MSTVQVVEKKQIKAEHIMRTTKSSHKQAGSRINQR